MAPSGSGRPVGLFGLHIQTSVAPRAASRTAGDVHGPALVPAQSRDGDHAPAALLGVDPVHRVGRHRDHGRIAGGQERLGAHVQDLVRARRPGTSSSVATP